MIRFHMNICIDASKIVFNDWLTCQDMKNYALGQNKEGYKNTLEILRHCLSEYLKKISNDLSFHGTRCTFQCEKLKKIEGSLLTNKGDKYLSSSEWNLLAHKDLQKTTLIIANILKTVHPTALNQLNSPPNFMLNVVEIAKALQGIDRVCRHKGEHNRTHLVDVSNHAMMTLTREKAWLPLFNFRTSNRSFFDYLCKHNEWTLADACMKKFNLDSTAFTQLSYMEVFNTLTEELEIELPLSNFKKMKDLIHSFIHDKPVFEHQENALEYRMNLLLGYLEKNIKSLLNNNQLERAELYLEVVSGTIEKKYLCALRWLIGEAKIDQMLLEENIGEAKNHFSTLIHIANDSKTHDNDQVLLACNRLSEKIIRKIIEKQNFEPAIEWAMSVIGLTKAPLITAKAFEITDCFLDKWSIEETKKLRIQAIFQRDAQFQKDIVRVILKNFSDSNQSEAAFSFIKIIFQWRSWLKADWVELCKHACRSMIDDGNYDLAEQKMNELLPEGEILKSVIRYIHYIKKVSWPSGHEMEIQVQISQAKSELLQLLIKNKQFKRTSRSQAILISPQKAKKYIAKKFSLFEQAPLTIRDAYNQFESLTHMKDQMGKTPKERFPYVWH